MLSGPLLSAKVVSAPVPARVMGVFSEVGKQFGRLECHGEGLPVRLWDSVGEIGGMSEFRRVVEAVCLKFPASVTGEVGKGDRAEEKAVLLVPGMEEDFI
jgi:hypothetical protein